MRPRALSSAWPLAALAALARRAGTPGAAATSRRRRGPRSARSSATSDQQVTLFDDRLVRRPSATTCCFESSDGRQTRLEPRSRASSVATSPTANGASQLRVRGPRTCHSAPAASACGGTGSCSSHSTTTQFTVTARADRPARLRGERHRVTATARASAATAPSTSRSTWRRSTRRHHVHRRRPSASRCSFGAGDVAMYNDQGFLMQLLEPARRRPLPHRRRETWRRSDRAQLLAPRVRDLQAGAPPARRARDSTTTPTGTPTARTTSTTTTS